MCALIVAVLRCMFVRDLRICAAAGQGLDDLRRFFCGSSAGLGSPSTGRTNAAVLGAPGRSQPPGDRREQDRVRPAATERIARAISSGRRVLQQVAACPEPQRLQGTLWSLSNAVSTITSGGRALLAEAVGSPRARPAAASAGP